MFVNDILNDKNYAVVSDKLESIKDEFKKFNNVNWKFKQYVAWGLEGLISNRVLTDIPNGQASSYCIGLNSGGLGLYYKTTSYQSRIEINSYLPTLKSMGTNEVAKCLVKSIKKRSKQIRFLNVIKALQKYDCDEVRVKIDYEIPFINPTNSDIKLSNYEDKKIMISDFRIWDGKLTGDSYAYIFNDMNNSISGFLIFEQLLDEIIDLEKNYTDQMENRISANEIIINNLKSELSGYLAAKSI